MSQASAPQDRFQEAITSVPRPILRDAVTEILDWRRTGVLKGHNLEDLRQRVAAHLGVADNVIDIRQTEDAVLLYAAREWSHAIGRKVVA